MPPDPYPPDPLTRRLQQLVSHPREDLSVEHKRWLDLREKPDRAKLARAAIAMANHGGGFIVVGFEDSGGDLESQHASPELPAVTQDAVNAAIRRYADPEFHCEVHFVEHPMSGVEHPVVVVPGNTVPVMATRDCDGVIAKHRCYVRKPGPRSEEPQSGDEWRRLFRSMRTVVPVGPVGCYPRHRGRTMPNRLTQRPMRRRSYGCSAITPARAGRS